MSKKSTFFNRTQSARVPALCGSDPLRVPPPVSRILCGSPPPPRSWWARGGVSSSLDPSHRQEIIIVISLGYLFVFRVVLFDACIACLIEVIRTKVSGDLSPPRTHILQIAWVIQFLPIQQSHPCATHIFTELSRTALRRPLALPPDEGSGEVTYV